MVAIDVVDHGASLGNTTLLAHGAPGVGAELVRA